MKKEEAFSDGVGLLAGKRPTGSAEFSAKVIIMFRFAYDGIEVGRCVSEDVIYGEDFHSFSNDDDDVHQLFQL